MTPMEQAAEQAFLSRAVPSAFARAFPFVLRLAF